MLLNKSSTPFARKFAVFIIKRNVYSGAIYILNVKTGPDCHEAKNNSKELGIQPVEKDNVDNA